MAVGEAWVAEIETRASKRHRAKLKEKGRWRTADGGNVMSQSRSQSERGPEIRQHRKWTKVDYDQPKTRVMTGT